MSCRFVASPGKRIQRLWHKKNIKNKKNSYFILRFLEKSGKIKTTSEERSGGKETIWQAEKNPRFEDKGV